MASLVFAPRIGLLLQYCGICPQGRPAWLGRGSNTFMADSVDGSVIPTAVGVNPALTIAAIAEKVSEDIKMNLPE